VAVSYQTPTRGNTGGNVTTWTFTYPALVANDLLILVVGSDGAPTFSTLPAGWTEIKDEDGNGAACHAMVAWKRAIGSETGTFTATSSALEGGGWQILCLRGAHVTDAPAISTGVSAATANPDPDLLDPAGWATEATLWIAAAVNDGNVAITAGPASYTNFINDRWANTAGAGVATATRSNAVASENPGAFTMGAEDSRAFTIAVRPAPVDLAGTSDGVAEMPATAVVARALVTDPGLPVDIHDMGDTATPPTDVLDSGNTATPPVDIIDSGGLVGAVAELAGDLTVSGVGVARDLDGASEAVAEFVAALSRDRPMVGAVEGVAEFVAELSRDRSVVGAVEAVAEHVAILGRDRGIVGAVEGVAEFVGVLSRSLTGPVEAIAEFVAELSRDRPIAGAVEAVAEHVAALSRDRPVAGAVEAVAELAGDLSVTGPAGGTVDLSGALEAVLEPAGVLGLGKALAGAVEAVGEHTAALGRDQGMVGAVEAVVEHVASLGRDRGMVGAVEGVAEDAGILAVGKALAGASEAVVQHVGDLGIAGQIVYIGASEAVAEHVASLGVARPIAAVSEAVAEHVAIPTRDRAIAGAVEAVVELAGIPNYTRGFAGVHQAVTELAAVLARGVGVEGVAQLVAEIGGDLVVIPLGFYEPPLLRLTGADRPASLGAVEDRRTLIAIPNAYKLTAIRED
jgi:hypothetical protein